LEVRIVSSPLQSSPGTCQELGVSPEAGSPDTITGSSSLPGGVAIDRRLVPNYHCDRKFKILDAFNPSVNVETQ